MSCLRWPLVSLVPANPRNKNWALAHIPIFVSSGFWDYPLFVSLMIGRYSNTFEHLDWTNEKEQRCQTSSNCCLRPIGWTTPPTCLRTPVSVFLPRLPLMLASSNSTQGSCTGRDGSSSFAISLCVARENISSIGRINLARLMKGRNCVEVTISV